jgi:hypothetical protein
MHNLRLDLDKVADMLLWNTRRCLFHEIAERKDVTYSATAACLGLNLGEDYLVKEAVTRIKRRCAGRRYWFEDWGEAGAWLCRV